MEITVTVNAPELAGAITRLALAIEGKAAINQDGSMAIPAGTVATVKGVETQPTAAPQAVQQPTPVPQAQQTAPMPTPQPTPVPQAAPAQAPAPQPTPVPQTAPTQKAITLNDLATAGAGLVDQGKMPQVIALLGKYGVQAITQLQPENFEAFAAELRALGASI